MQYRHGSETGVYVISPLKDTENREFEGIFKCELKQGEIHLQCTMDNLGLAAAQSEKRAVPYPIVSQARNSESILTCQQFKEHKKRSTTDELNGICSLLTNENGLNKNWVYAGLAKTVYDYLVKKNENNNTCATDGLLLHTSEDFRKDIMESKKCDAQNTDSNNNNNNNNKITYDSDDEEGGTEIAIVLDGSGSIDEEDFLKAKDFISNLITRVWGKCSECDFAVVQYGHVIQTEFDLQDSSRGINYILDKVQKIQQIGNVTKTASALLHVLDNIFSERHGSKESATKIILVLTDGDIFMDPVNLTTVINSPKMERIERFSIGVGSAFNSVKAFNELTLIATDEKDHVIRVDDYSKLDGLISSLQQRIIGIEGTKGDSLEFDLAQTGFAVHLKDKHTLMLGAVGAFDWSGGLMLYRTDTEPHKVTFLNESSDNAKSAAYSYLGYSVSSAQGNRSSFYIAGAPRHSNIGKVIVFEEDATAYKLWQILEGEQLGSYFGHQLCTLDVTLDGFTDFLLVGAPFYHVKGEEGRVYIYKLTIEGKFHLVLKLEQQNYAFARFGYSIANIGDINQDGYQDIAIGAPLERHFENPDSFGSVYIYNSDANGIHAIPSQRITATDLKQKLQFFGQSVDGGLDLTGDGYHDISVGSLRNVMVLRSRPVVTVQATLHFEPDKIPLIYTNKTLQASLCFTLTPFNKPEFAKSFLHYNMELDVFMEEKRITFQDKSSSKGKLLIKDKCAKHILTVLPCNYDCYSDIVINISYALGANLHSDLPSPILDFYDKHYTQIKLQYEKDCGNKTTCTPDLKLTTLLSREELVVGSTKDLMMTLSLENSGDDSYMTNVTLIYPENLHFNMIKPPNNPGVKCSNSKLIQSSNSTMTCSIRHPVFGATKESFSIVWQLTEDKFSNAVAIIYSIVNNFNNVSAPLLQKTVLPVRHSFSAVLSVQQKALYVEIPPEPAMFQDIQFTFNVNAENTYGAELSLELQIPLQCVHGSISQLKSIVTTQDTSQCKNETKSCGNALITKEEEASICLFLRCNIALGREEITITATLFLQTLKKLSIMILEKKEMNIMPVVIGSSIGGILLLLVIVVILIKCGFFKRKYKNFDQNEE
ncbi:integrin alpha-E isoform X2 [Pseudophryne corroboree]|uniref:integrin alpha-E isoform X2 n=1 Tax=Pseudophryne corroboree TaxID=495146 RepID=UPI003081A9EB